MSEVIEIGMGELSVGKAPTAFSTSGVGSCLVVCLYSSVHHVGGMAHIMLPKNLLVGIPIEPSHYRYADVAIAVMLEKIEALGVRKTSLIAKIAGGANMFPGVQGRSQKVGEKNILSVREILGKEGISISAEHVGGTVGRTVRFDVGNGIVSIQSNI